MVDAMIMIMVDAMKQATGTLVDCKSVFVIHRQMYIDSFVFVIHVKSYKDNL